MPDSSNASPQDSVALVVETLVVEYAPEVLKQIHVALGERIQAPKKPGHPVIDDDALLRRMADMLIVESPPSERRAADILSREHPGHSQSATKRRLRRKFAENREALLRDARFRAKLRESSDPSSASRLLHSHLATEFDELRHQSNREAAVIGLKQRLVALVDDVKDYLDATELTDELSGITRPFPRADVERMFDDDLEFWDIPPFVATNGEDRS